MRLLCVGAATLAMLLTGWRLRHRHRNYALGIQGGGIGCIVDIRLCAVDGSSGFASHRTQPDVSKPVAAALYTHTEFFGYDCGLCAVGTLVVVESNTTSRSAKRLPSRLV
ncbi:MAG: hypothetical protein OEU36_16670 [Gammaproteobacteria bacterium]|nr:hypothetical protein [Gammaproteobacteria bacterium]